MTSTLEDNFLKIPRAGALYRSTDGAYGPELPERVSATFVAGCAPAGSKNLVKDKLKQDPKWKEDPERVIKTMTKAFEEFEPVEIELRYRSKGGRASTSGES